MLSPGQYMTDSQGRSARTPLSAAHQTAETHLCGGGVSCGGQGLSDFQPASAPANFVASRALATPSEGPARRSSVGHGRGDLQTHSAHGSSPGHTGRDLQSRNAGDLS